MEDEFSDLAEEEKPCRKERGRLCCKICDFICLGSGEYFRHVASVKHQRRKADIRRGPLQTLTDKHPSVAQSERFFSQSQNSEPYLPQKSGLFPPPHVWQHCTSYPSTSHHQPASSFDMGHSMFSNAVVPHTPGLSSSTTGNRAERAVVRRHDQFDDFKGMEPLGFPINQSTPLPGSANGITVNISCNSFAMSSISSQTQSVHVGNFPVALNPQFFKFGSQEYRERDPNVPIPKGNTPKPFLEYEPVSHQEYSTKSRRRFRRQNPAPRIQDSKKSVGEMSNTLSNMYLSEQSAARMAPRPCDTVEPNFGSVLGMFRPIGAPFYVPPPPAKGKGKGNKRPARVYTGVVKPGNFPSLQRSLAIADSETSKDPPHQMFGFHMFKFEEMFSSDACRPIKRSRLFGHLDEIEHDNQIEKHCSTYSDHEEPQRKMPRTQSPTPHHSTAQKPSGKLRPLPKQIPYIALNPGTADSQETQAAARCPIPTQPLQARRPLPKQIPYIKPRFLTQTLDKNRDSKDESSSTQHRVLKDRCYEKKHSLSMERVRPDRMERGSYSSQDVHKDRHLAHYDQDRLSEHAMVRNRPTEKLRHHPVEHRDNYSQKEDKNLHRFSQPAADRFCSAKVIRTLDRLAGISSSFQPVREIILDKLSEGVISDRHLPRIFEELDATLQPSSKPSAELIVQTVEQIIGSYSKPSPASTAGNNSGTQSNTSHHPELDHVNRNKPDRKLQRNAVPVLKQKTHTDPCRSPPYVYDDPLDRIYDSDSDPQRLSASKQLSESAPLEITKPHTEVVRSKKLESNKNALRSGSALNTNVFFKREKSETSPKKGTQFPLEVYDGTNRIRKRDLKVLYLRGHDLGHVEHEIWKNTTRAICIDMRPEYKQEQFHKTCEVYITFNSEDDAAANLNGDLEHLWFAGKPAHVEYMYTEDQDFKAIIENGFPEGTDTMVMSMTGKGLGCQMRHLRHFLPFAKDIYIPVQYKQESYKNIMVTAYATFELQSDANLTFYKLQGTKFHGQKLKASYAKKGELSRVQSEDFWYPGRTRMTKPEVKLFPEETQVASSSAEKKKCPIENYFNHENDSRPRNLKRLMVQGYKIADEVSRRYIYNKSVGEPLVLMRAEYGSVSQAQGWVQVYLTFCHEEHADLTLNGLKKVQVKSMPLEVQYMYEDDADFNELYAQLWRNFNQDMSMVDLHCPDASCNIYQLRHVIRTSYYILMVDWDEYSGPKTRWRAYFREAEAGLAVSQMTMNLPNGAPVTATLAEHPFMDNNKGFLADLAHQLMRMGRLVHVGENQGKLMVRSRDNHISTISTNLDFLELNAQ